MIKKTLRIFLSYASEQRDDAEEIEAGLNAVGYEVFFDKKSLPVGEEYNRKIYDAIRASDLMIFLISPNSIEAGSYARTELMFAQEIWKNPDRRVFPILVRDIDFSKLPDYLKSVTVLKPVGNISAEVVRTIDAFASKNKNKTILEITDELNEQIKNKEIERLLSEIESDWEEERKKHTIKINGVEIDYIPSTYLIGFIPLSVGLVFSIFAYSNLYDHFGLFPALFSLILGIGATIYFCNGVKGYKKREEDYLRKRESILNAEINSSNDV